VPIRKKRFLIQKSYDKDGEGGAGGNCGVGQIDGSGEMCGVCTMGNIPEDKIGDYVCVTGRRWSNGRFDWCIRAKENVDFIGSDAHILV
jgi:hypothetical protein